MEQFLCVQDYGTVEYMNLGMIMWIWNLYKLLVMFGHGNWVFCAIVN